MTASITCPDCGATSYHPADVIEGYCGRCHAYTRRRHCDRCGADVPEPAWVGDDHVVLVQGPLRLDPTPVDRDTNMLTVRASQDVRFALCSEVWLDAT